MRVNDTTRIIEKSMMSAAEPKTAACLPIWQVAAHLVVLAFSQFGMHPGGLCGPFMAYLRLDLSWNGHLPGESPFWSD